MKISEWQPKISDSLKNSDFSNSLGVLQHPQAPPAIRLWVSNHVPIFQRTNRQYELTLCSYWFSLCAALMTSRRSQAEVNFTKYRSIPLCCISSKSKCVIQSQSSNSIIRIMSSALASSADLTIEWRRTVFNGQSISCDAKWLTSFRFASVISNQWCCLGYMTVPGPSVHGPPL